MKAIAKKIWEEPAVALGALVSLILLVGGIIDGHMDWNANHIIAVLAPLITALGIRPLVQPVKHDEPTGTTYQPPPEVAAEQAVNPATKLPTKTGFEDPPPKPKS